MYAIIATGGKQYRVKEGDVLKVEKLGLEPGAAYTFNEVLAVSAESLKIGSPLVEGASVSATVEKERRLLYINTREKQAIIRKTATDSSLHSLK